MGALAREGGGTCLRTVLRGIPALTTPVSLRPLLTTESPGRTSDHSPVIQMYSQGCKLQLSRSAGRLLGSQCPPCTSPPLSSSTHSTLRYLVPSPQVLVHCRRQAKRAGVRGYGAVMSCYHLCDMLPTVYRRRSACCDCSFPWLAPL